MPLIKSLSKVTKKLAKQSSGSLHVKGRKFKQLNRATEREHKIKAKKAQYAEQKNHELLFYLYLQERIAEDPETESARYNVDEMRGMVTKYIDRNDEEIADMEKERRPGRPMTNRHQIMLEKRKHDHHLYATGFRMPDLSDLATTFRVRHWNGTSGSVSAWKFTLVNKEPADVSGDFN